MRPDLASTRNRVFSGEATPADEMAESIAIASSPACANVFLEPKFDDARRAAAQPGLNAKPLAGLAISIKDLFDIQGQPTVAGSRALAGVAGALADSPAVERLKAAGGVVLGRTNMSEFAFSGVGVNPHFGTPVNPADPKTPRIPGGSSSGAAVSVATGAAFIGLGSDTGGSIRTPAALCGIVGFKNTARLVPTEGALPLSTTLDTVCAMTRSVEDAIIAHQILALRTVTRSHVPLAGYRLAVAKTSMLDALDATVATAFERALKTLRDAGARIEEIPLAEIRDLGTIQSTGGFAAVESYAWHRNLLAEKAAVYDQRVRARIERGATIKAHEYIDLIRARRDWMARVEKALAGFDAVLSPTCPIVAPPIAQVMHGTGDDPAANGRLDEEFFRVNALLLRNCSVVNMLDGCAISIPCHVASELPAGLMIWQSAMRDDTVLNIALQAQHVLDRTSRDT
ncbi:MAG TPA: amidase [Ramlibacter sp.]|nr:amidase [Ramlibacter sp.]